MGILRELYYFTLIVSTIYSLFLFKKLSITYKIVVFWLIFSLITEGLAKFFAIEYQNNFPVYTLFNICQVIFIGLFYYLLFEKKKNIQRLILVVCFLFLLYALPNYIQNPFLIGHKNKLITVPIIIFFIFTYFYFLLKDLEVKNLKKAASFWISVGLLFYFTITFFSFLFKHFVLQEYLASLESGTEHSFGKITHYANDVNLIANTLKFIMVSIGLTYAARNI